MAEHCACPRCGDPGFVNIAGERLCGNPGCDHTEPLETGVETVTISAADWRGAVSLLRCALPYIDAKRAAAVKARITEYLHAQYAHDHPERSGKAMGSIEREDARALVAEDAARIDRRLRERDGLKGAAAAVVASWDRWLANGTAEWGSHELIDAIRELRAVVGRQIGHA
jgi:hypothetical protein